MTTLNDMIKNMNYEHSVYVQIPTFINNEDAPFISKVLHKTVIEVNESGTKAATATVVEEIKEEAMEVEAPLAFIANRPFMFMIYNNENDTILFMGKIEKF